MGTWCCALLGLFSLALLGNLSSAEPAKRHRPIITKANAAAVFRDADEDKDDAPLPDDGDLDEGDLDDTPEPGGGREPDDELDKAPEPDDNEEPAPLPDDDEEPAPLPDEGGDESPDEPSEPTILDEEPALSPVDDEPLIDEEAPLPDEDSSLPEGDGPMFYEDASLPEDDAPSPEDEPLRAEVELSPAETEPLPAEDAPLPEESDDLVEPKVNAPLQNEFAQDDAAAAEDEAPLADEEQEPLDELEIRVMEDADEDPSDEDPAEELPYDGDEPARQHKAEKIKAEEVEPEIDDGLKPVTKLQISVMASMKGPASLAKKRFDREGVIHASYCRNRPWAPTFFSWEATALCHGALYFEEPNLERLGYSAGILQPAVSAAHFFGTIPALPYLIAAHPQTECVYTLGQYRAGSHAPLSFVYPRIDPKAALFQGGVVAGLIILIP